MRTRRSSWEGVGLAGVLVAMWGCEKVNPDFDVTEVDSSTDGGTTNGSTTTATSATSVGTATSTTDSTTTDSTTTDSTTTTDPSSSTTDPLTTTDSTSGSTGDDTGSTGEFGEGSPCNNGSDCMAPFPLCGPSGCQDGSEGDDCNGDLHCGGGTAICGPSGCQDGDEGDPCNNADDCGDAAPICSFASTCQDGSEGDACDDGDDCGGTAPICSSNDVCQDGNEGDACSAPADCGTGTPICSADQVCQDGDEGDGCGSAADCGAGAPLCSSAAICQDGNLGDACGFKSDCDDGLTCDTTCTPCATVTDVNVVAHIDHTFVGDLTIKLQSPDDSVEMLVSIPGGNESSDDGNVQVGQVGDATDLSVPITFDDAAAVSSEEMGADIANGAVCVDSAVCEFHSSGYPDTELNLTNFNGETAPGTWTLCVGDSTASDLGTLQDWQLVLTCDVGGPATVDSGTVAIPIPDDGYDGTLGSMGCSSVTF